MRTKWNKLWSRRHRLFAVWLLALAGGDYLRSSLAVDLPQILSVRAGSGKFAMSWSGNSQSYDVQRTTDIHAPSWHTVFSTALTNAVLPLSGNSSFFRVVDPKTSFTSLVLSSTNLTTGDTNTLTLLPSTNADLTFALPDDGSGVATLLVIPYAALQQADVALTESGGFEFQTNGVSTGIGGALSAVAGPGTNDLTVTGYMTNGTDTLVFSAVSDPSSFLIDLNGILVGSIFEQCLRDPASAAKTLQCQNACGSKNTSCFFSTFPNFGLKVGVCQFIGTYNAKVGQSITNPCTFDLQCKLCCKFNYDAQGTNLVDCSTQ